MVFEELDESSSETASSNEESSNNNSEVNSSKLEYLYDIIIYLTNFLVKFKDKNKLSPEELK